MPSSTIAIGAPLRIGSAAVAGVTYTWACDNWSCGLSDPNASNPWVAPEGNTAYKVTATDGKTCSGSDVVVITTDGLRWQELFRGSFISRLIRRADSIDIHIIARRKR